MACWPSYITGIVAFALIFYDLFTKNWTDLPLHAGAGILLTGLLYAVCIFLGTAISASILLIPAIFILGFFFALWYTGEDLRKRGCCIRCKEPNSEEVCIEGPIQKKKKDICEPGLKATPVY